jgi:hypothetical protein
LTLEVTERVFSFCTGKDLLRLTETCIKFKKLITESTPLMEKLRIVIDINLDPADEKRIVECIESRRFSAARLHIDDTVKEANDVSKESETFRLLAHPT